MADGGGRVMMLRIKYFLLFFRGFYVCYVIRDTHVPALCLKYYLYHYYYHCHGFLFQDDDDDDGKSQMQHSFPSPFLLSFSSSSVPFSAFLREWKKTCMYICFTGCVYVCVLLHFLHWRPELLNSQLLKLVTARSRQTYWDAETTFTSKIYVASLPLLSGCLSVK